MPDPFFQRRLEWSQWKHKILQKYLHVWVSKLGRLGRPMVYIDACAGAGTYESGEPGSPLIAAGWNDTFLRDRGARLLVIACEQEDESAQRLEEALRPWSERRPPEAHVVRGSFVAAVPELLEATRRNPTFLFVDPYGMKDLTADQLRCILGDRRRAPTEALVRVDPNLIARFSGWLTRRPRSAKGERTAEAFRRRIARYNLAPELLEELAAADPSAPSVKGLRQAIVFEHYLTVFEERFKFVQLVPIRPSYFAAPKYFLVHGTDNVHGVAKLNDVLSTTEDDLFRASEDAARAETGQQSLFEPQRVLAASGRPRVTVADASRIIPEVLADGMPKQFVEIRAELALRFGPDLREKDHRAAARILLDDGRVRRAGPTTASRAIDDATLLQLATRA